MSADRPRLPTPPSAETVLVAVVLLWVLSHLIALTLPV